MNGGYLMVSKTDTNLYEKLNKALTLGKPVLWYEDENTCYYIDTITKSGTDIILTKGGKTITIKNDGDITENGDIQPKEYEYAIRIETADYSLFLKRKITDLKFDINTRLSINKEIFDFLRNDLLCLRKEVVYEDSNEQVYVIYEVDDADTYNLTIYDETGTEVSGSGIITYVTFYTNTGFN